MRAFTRLAAPAVLNTPFSKKYPIPRWVHYGNRYTANRVKDPGFVFQWPTVENQPLNQCILPFLQKQTANHCSYCDSYPVPKGSRTIDHFLPKSEYCSSVCEWENLYFACGHCQASKKEKYDSLVLRPDDPDYFFSKYFVYDFENHTIEINPKASLEEQERARATHQMFDFNETALTKSRERAFVWYQNKDDSKELDDFDFRFMFDLLE